MDDCPELPNSCYDLPIRTLGVGVRWGGRSEHKDVGLQNEGPRCKSAVASGLGWKPSSAKPTKAAWPAKRLGQALVVVHGELEQLVLGHLG